MKYFAFMVAVCPAFALADWSNLPTVLGDLSGEQVQPKVRTCPDGSSYISWFDSTGGGYDVRLQHLNINGNEMWAHNGLLVADLTNSSTQDYDLAVDAQGNAYLAFQDTRVIPGLTTASVQKISPAGALLWGANGVNLSSGLSANQPKVCVLSDGSVAAAYTGSNNFTLKRYDTLGNPIGTAVTISETSKAMSLSDLEAGDGTNVIAMWMKATGTSSVTSNKWLYAQKFNSAGTGLWTGTATGTWASGVPVVVFNANSIQNGYFPTIIGDGNGGFVTAWYETGASRHAYLQHINPDGSARFPANGVATVENLSGRIQLSAGLAYDRWSGTYYVTSDDSSTPTQGSYSIIVQKFDRNGARQWPVGLGPKNGVTVQPINGQQKSFTQCQFYGDGVLVLNMDYRGSSPGAITQAALNANGTENFGVTVQNEAYAGGTNKARLTSWLDMSGDTVSAWTDGTSGIGDLYATRMGSGGRIGNGTSRIFGVLSASDYLAPLQDVNWLVTISQGATTETRMVRTMSTGNWWVDTNLTGTVTVTVDGSHWTKRRVSNFVIGSGTIFNSMINGDADGSGEVDAADIDQVIADFGDVLFTPTYTLNSDVDGSGEVDAADIDLVIANFGTVDE